MQSDKKKLTDFEVTGITVDPKCDKSWDVSPCNHEVVIHSSQGDRQCTLSLRKLEDFKDFLTPEMQEHVAGIQKNVTETENS